MNKRSKVFDLNEIRCFNVAMPFLYNKKSAEPKILHLQC